LGAAWRRIGLVGLSRSPHAQGRGDREAEHIVNELEELEQLANLPTLLDDAFPFPRQRDYAAFWAKNREVTDLLRENHLPHEDRERLWARKSALCARVKELQTSECEARENESRQNTEQVLDLLGEAESWAKGAERFEHLREVRTRLAEAATPIKERYLSHDDRRMCWDRWWEVTRLLGFRAKELAEARRREREARTHGRRERLEEAIRRRRTWV